MGKIYYIIGKSSTGKDTIFNRLIEDETLGLEKIIQYSTRPKRDKEVEGREYHFISEEEEQALFEAGKIIEKRSYNTVHGIWTYMMVDDGAIDLEKHNYLAVGTAESFKKVSDFFGKRFVVPIYVEVETGERIFRAVMRERKSATPKYAEMCRRFLADEADYSEAKLKEAGLVTKSGKIRNLVENDDIDRCVKTIRQMIRRRIRAEQRKDGV